MRAVGDTALSQVQLQIAEKEFATVAARLGKGAIDSAHGMQYLCIVERANCLLAEGKLDVAADAFKTSIKHAERLGHVHNAMAGKAQLGAIYLYQGDYHQALMTFNEARIFFSATKEPGNEARAWHQIGDAHQGLGAPWEAEDAYRKALAIRVKTADVVGQFNTLTQLGTLYAYVLRRPTEAVSFYRKALNNAVARGDTGAEGGVHNNLAGALFSLNQFDEAKNHIQNAIKCKVSFGFAAEPWTSWAILSEIETALGDTVAAGQAKQEAIDAYLTYRRAGGENHAGQPQLCMHISALLKSGDVNKAQTLLQQLAARPENAADSGVVALLETLKSIVQGNRDVGLAQNDRLDFANAAEIILLLESLSPHK